VQIGDVIRWNEYPYPQYNNIIKPRWFIYIGCTDIFSIPLQYYFVTTTTRPTRIITPKDVCSLLTNKFSFFTSNCYIDFDERPITIIKSLVEKNLDIEKVGELDEKTLKEIYNGIRKSSKYSFQAILDIYNSFDRAGITDLEKPVFKRSGTKIRKKKKSN
jgi:hypothetical protein